MRRFVLALSLCSCPLIVACHKATTTGDDDQTFTDAPAITGTEYSATWGPVTLQPGEESTMCIWLHLSNTDEIKVHQVHDTLTESSHHVIVYKDDKDTTEQLTPMPCQPFTGALNASGMIAPLVISQKKDDLITLPEGVAYTFAANQMIKVEMHNINSTDAVETAMAQVDFYAADPATIHDDASVLLIGSPDINIGAGQMATLHQFFTVPSYLDLSASHIWAVTGHEHQMGTGVEVNLGTSKTDTNMKPVYNPDPFLWSEPVTQAQAPDFAVPVGGGFDFTSTWTNPSAAAVKFGESATDEMCFFWTYYWPSQGSMLCIHTDSIGAQGYDACCPGDSSCSLINQMLGAS